MVRAQRVFVVDFSSDEQAERRLRFAAAMLPRASSPSHVELAAPSRSRSALSPAREVPALTAWTPLFGSKDKAVTQWAIEIIEEAGWHEALPSRMPGIVEETAATADTTTARTLQHLVTRCRTSSLGSESSFSSYPSVYAVSCTKSKTSLRRGEPVGSRPGAADAEGRLLPQSDISRTEKEITG